MCILVLDSEFNAKEELKKDFKCTELNVNKNQIDTIDFIPDFK